MLYFAVDKNGTEKAFIREPYRCANWYWDNYEEYSDGWEDHTVFLYTELSKGTIKRLLGIELTWEDEPYKIG